MQWDVSAAGLEMENRRVIWVPLKRGFPADAADKWTEAEGM